MAYILLLVLAPLIIAPIALYFAWAASLLWGWFIVPIFGAPSLSILQMWGVCLTLNMMRPRISLEKEGTDGWQIGLFSLVCGPPIAVGFGYAIKFWWLS